MLGKGKKFIRCRECGYPRLSSFFIKFNNNGTITQMMRRNFRIVILPHGFIDNLFSSIEARIGISIEHIAFEAQRNASKATFDAFMTKIPLAPVVTRLKFVRRVAVELFHRVGILTGMAYSETLEYIPGRLGVARFRNPFNIDLMAANVVGAFESLEGIPFSQTWEQECKDSYVIHIDATGGKPEIADRRAREFT